MPGLLASKLQPPRQCVSLVERFRLIDRLERGLSQRLNLIYAPAGFGKTSLLTQWHDHLTGRGVPVAWLSFDADDTDPLQCIAYLAWTLSSVAPQLGRMLAQTSGRATSRAVRAGLARILNELQKAGDCVLLLDDYHLVQAREIHDLIMQLVKAAPASLHIVIASRSRSLLPVSGLVVQGHVTEVGPDDLRFSHEEVGCIFGPSLDPEAVQLLLQRTEGWAMAVQLARHWADGSTAPEDRISQFSGGSGDVATYLTEQIMRDLPAHVRELIVQTSITEEINGDLANAICGRDDAWDVLGSLEHLAALLVPIDPDRGWFRFHHLFADYLRSRLHMLGEERVRALHMAASSWFSTHGHLDRAVKHAALAGEYTAAAELIEDAGAVWLSVQHGAPRLRRILEYLPVTFIDLRPRLRAVRALLWMKDGLLIEARREIEEIRLMEGSTLWDEDAAKDVLLVGAAITGQGDDGVVMEVVVALEGLIGEAARTNRWSQGVLNELLSLTHTRRGNVILAVPPAREAMHIYDEAGAVSGGIFSRLHLAIPSLAQGRLEDAVQGLTTAVALGREHMANDTSTMAMIEVVFANALYERNELGLAETLCFRALEEVENAEGWLEVFNAGYMTASGLHLARRDFAAALDVVARGKEVAARRGLRRLLNILEHRRLEILTLAGDGEVAVLNIDAMFSALAENAQALTLLEREVVTIALCRIAIRHGAVTRAVSFLEVLQRDVEKLGRGRTVIKLLILKAFAARALGTMDAAATAIRKALGIAVPEGWRRLFLEEGPEIVGLLDETLKHMQVTTLHPTAVTFLAELFSAHIDPEGKHRDEPAEILKPREQEVLRGLKHGQSNKMIARDLELTDNAIKYHLKKIYAKLGVSNRSMAVHVAERHGIL